MDTHNRPELTAEKFIPDPFGSEPGARLYKTGDLVRYLARRSHRVSGSSRPPSEDPWLPHRIGRNRSPPVAATRRCGRPWCWRAKTCPATSGWWRIDVVEPMRRTAEPRRCASTCRPLCPNTWFRRRIVRLESLAIDVERQAGSAGVAGAGGRCVRGARVRSAGGRDRDGAGGDLGGSAQA